MYSHLLCTIMSNNIFPIYDQLVSRQEKEDFLNQQGAVFWLTGLSGSGKSTMAKQLERQLFNEGFVVQVLDGDNVRSGINNNLGFSEEDRKGKHSAYRRSSEALQYIRNSDHMQFRQPKK